MDNIELSKEDIGYGEGYVEGLNDARSDAKIMLNAAEQRAAQLETERDEWKARYELAFRVANEKQDERDTSRAELKRYQGEREQLLARVEELVAELRECMNANTLSAQAQS